MTKQPIDILKEKLSDISHIGSALSLLNWDQEVHMPEKGADRRATSVAAICAILHNKILALDEDGLLSNLKKDLDTKMLKGKDSVIVAETWRTFDRERKFPESFVREMAEVTSMSQQVWAKARAANNFKMFLPWLTRVVDLKRKEAQFVGYTDSPYDALIDAYEPGMTGKEASQILNDLKDFLVPFIKKLRASKVKIDSKKIKGNFPIDKQILFNEMIAKKIGFDFSSGRLDKSTHPFSTSFHPNDVRITTRYRTDDIFHSIGSTIHEAGHGMYEQGLPAVHFGTPLAESVSLGIHESQSRMWENNIGKSKAFWKYFYPTLQKEFSHFKKLKLEDFYKAINQAKPTLIRTESDEVTYNLHIIIRFEIEKELIEGSIDPKDLPKIWKVKVKEYLGIEVPNDREGVLQDVHWSCGLMGYFPTYSFGNLYAAQLFATLSKQIPGLAEKISKGKFEEIKKWLNKNVHAHGKTYTAQALVKKVTGEYLNSRYWSDYIEKKYKEIYKI